MMPQSPHFLLFSEASQDESATLKWRFVLQNVRTKQRLTATDSEPLESCSERLELLAVVRGLEALECPAQVTLVTKSRYVSRGIKKGLAEWRENDWSWERFGRMVAVRDHDLWKRIDRALSFHEVDCQAWLFEMPERHSVQPAACGASTETSSTESAGEPNSPRSHQRSRLRSPRKIRNRKATSWSGRWTEAVDALSRPMGLSLGSGSAG